jgi:hypothetical protein
VRRDKVVGVLYCVFVRRFTDLKFDASQLLKRAKRQNSDYFHPPRKTQTTNLILDEVG